MRYDRIEEFNVDSKADCAQLNLAHVARKQRQSVKAVKKEPERLWRKGL